MNFKYRIVSIMLRAGFMAGALAAAAVPAAQVQGFAGASPATVTPDAVHAAPASGTAVPAGTTAAAAPADTAAATGTPGTPAAAAPAGTPPSDAPPADFKTLDQEVQGMKKDVIDLNKDLFVLQEELLFPSNTQVAVYVSMDVGAFFALDSVTLKIDNKEVKNYLYTAREAEALLKGGVQEIYLGNLKVGKHELVAFFTGKGPVERDYKRGATVNFDKGVGAKYLELKITDRVMKHQPEFKIKDWE
jgi:hypothetical protein